MVPADEHVGHVVVQVLVWITHVAAVQEQRMVEQRAVAVLGLGQLVAKYATIATWYWLIFESVAISAGSSP
jgi:hypothetical protein